VGGEGHAVSPEANLRFDVGADRGGQAARLEQAMKRGEDGGFRGALRRLDLRMKREAWSVTVKG
jgi:hypothetical protein